MHVFLFFSGYPVGGWFEGKPKNHYARGLPVLTPALMVFQGLLNEIVRLLGTYRDLSQGFWALIDVGHGLFGSLSSWTYVCWETVLAPTNSSDMSLTNPLRN